MTDFTNCPILPGGAYNGANGSKITSSLRLDSLTGLQTD